MQKKLVLWVSAAAGLLAIIVVVYTHVPAKKTDAAVQNIPTVTLQQTRNGSGDILGESIGIDSPGPFDEDFQIVVCLHPTEYNGDHEVHHDDVCATTAWASEAGVAGKYTAWTNPGGPNYFQAPGANLYVQKIITRPLPSNEQLDNVVLGIQLTDSDSATPPADLDINQSCGPQFTPYNGGYSPEASAYRYGNCSEFSGEADWYRTFISAQIRSVSGSGTIPSQMDPGATITTSTITMTNVGTAALHTSAASWKETDLAPGTGKCVDSNGDGIPDEAPGVPGTITIWPDDDPPAVIPTNTCTVQTNLTLGDITLTHSGQFTTPQTIPYTLNNVTKVTQSYPATVAILCLGGGSHVTGDCLNPKRGSTNPAHTDTYYNGTYAQSFPSLASGTVFMFGINPLTAPSTTGSYPETWTFSDADGPVAGGQFTQMIQVGAATGAANVISKNSQTGAEVTSSWYLTASAVPGMDVCLFDNLPCSGKSQSYGNLPTNDDIVGVDGIQGSAGPYMALRGVEERSFANAKKSDNLFSNFFALSKTLLIGVANAQDYCGYLGAAGLQCSSTSSPNLGLGVNYITLTNPNDTANFTILWDPEAGMSVTPTSVSLTPASPSEQVAIANSSDAPGSALGWTASVPADASSWLSVTPLASANPNGVVKGSPDSATFSYIGSMATGTYQTTVTFNGTTVNINNKKVIPQSVSVTLTIGQGGGSNPCTGNCTPTSTPNPTSTPTSTPRTGSLPVCDMFTANPMSIVPPQSSQLSYYCMNVSACTLSGGQFGTSGIPLPSNGTTVDGYQSVTPKQNTIYTLSCKGTGTHSGDTVGGPLQVTVTNPGRIEINP